jgi:ATP-dependent Lhr-like helicase
VFGTGELIHDVLASLNSSELAQRRFREIARVAGLVSTGYPGQPKSTRQLQASSACSSRCSASTTRTTCC